MDEAARQEIDRLNEAMNQMLRRFIPREPRYRYWQTKDGWMFGWTTEKMGDGKYAAFIRKPIGKGARSGKATSFKKVKELHFAKRSTAKKRAEQWMKTHSRSRT